MAVNFCESGSQADKWIALIWPFGCFFEFIGLGGCVMFLQYIFYGIILGIGNSKGKFGSYFSLLLGVHVLAVIIAEIMVKAHVIPD